MSSCQAHRVQPYLSQHPASSCEPARGVPCSSTQPNSTLTHCGLVSTGLLSSGHVHIQQWKIKMWLFHNSPTHTPVTSSPTRNQTRCLCTITQLSSPPRLSAHRAVGRVLAGKRRSSSPGQAFLLHS